MNLFPITVLGAFIGLDVVSFPQVMISRPIVASTIAAAFTGDATAGLIIGIVLEMIALDTQPFGASRYPEWGTAAVIGGALCGAHSVSRPGVLAATLLASLITAMIAGWSMMNIRQRNVRRVRLAHYAVEHGSRRAVVGVQLYGLVGDLIRGAVVTFIALLVSNPLVNIITQHWTLGLHIERIAVVAVAAPVAVIAIKRVVH